MAVTKSLRLGVQILLALSLLTVAFVLFCTMHYDGAVYKSSSYYQGEKQLIEHQTANGHHVSKVSSRQQPTKELDRAQEVPDMPKIKQASKAQDNNQKVSNTPITNDPKLNPQNQQQTLNGQHVLTHPLKKTVLSHAANIDGSMSNAHSRNQLSKSPGSTHNVSNPASSKQLSQLPNSGVHVSHPPIRNQSPKSQSKCHPLSNSPDRNSLDNIPLTSAISQSKVRQNMSNINGKVRKKKRARYLIYLCDKYRYCGGWGDRQKGFVSTSVLAIVTGRTFGINMSVPCDIKLFYIPNQINWYVKTPEIRGLSLQVVDWMNNASLVDLESDFNRVYTRDVVFLKTNLDLINKIKKSQRYGHLVPAEYRNISTAFANGWHKLMKPTFHLEEHLDMFMDNIPDKGDLVCAHIRLQKNPTIPNDGVVLNTLSSVDALWKFLSRFEKNASRIFIASDSIDVRKSARKHLGRKELDTNGLVLHIDRQRGWTDACVGFEMALLEQAVLTKCKVLVMSRSGFSGRATMISRIKQTVFLFRNGTILYKNRVIFN